MLVASMNVVNENVLLNGIGFYVIYDFPFITLVEVGKSVFGGKNDMEPDSYK